MRRPLTFAGVALVALSLGAAPALAAPLADLRADVNRDGVASLSDPADDLGEDTWDASHGAIVLPNVDDDGRRCAVRARLLPDRQIARCNDATDAIVNGVQDELDLAPLAVAGWPEAPADATATIAIAELGRGRLFIRRGGELVALSTGRLTLDELRSGVGLALEARDIARDTRVWSGYLTVTLTVQGGGESSSDTVKLRVAPVLFQHDLMPVSRLLATPPVPSDPGEFAFSQNAFDPKDTATRRALAVGRRLASSGQRELFDGLRRGLAQAGFGARLQSLRPSRTDIWAQDVFEPGYASVPAVGGTHTMRILIRSANANRTGRRQGRPLRDAGRPVFTQLQSQGIGAVQQYSPAWQRNSPAQDTYSSTGNFAAIPPYSLGDHSFPAGRILYGSAPGHAPDPSFVRMLAAQGAQAPVVLDTSWLVVGHIDEFITFLPAPTARGWVAAVADPAGAIALLQQARASGHGAAPVFAGLDEPEFSSESSKLRVRLQPSERSVSSLLASRRLRRANVHAAAEIELALSMLRAETGLTDSEIVRVPVLFAPAPPNLHSSGLLALLPNAVNGISLGGGVYLAPRQHGPMVAGTDLFEQTIRERLRAISLRVSFVEDWFYAHRGVGELHCVTNTLRTLDGALPWWTATR